MAKKDEDLKNKKDDEKSKAIEVALKHIKKEFGEGAIMKLGENQKMNIEVVSSGSLKLDMALGLGGFPKGRIVEVYGPESSGKTTIALHAIAETQKKGGVAAFIDAEHALDPVYAKNLGVNIDELLISQPDTGEQALEIADVLVRSGAVDIIVIDSVAALVPKAEIEGDMGDAHVGLQARLMSQALRKLTGSLSKSKTLMVFINQIRDKVGGGFSYGPTETTTGGRALKFYASIRIDVRRIGSIKQGESVIGNEVKVKVTKNKVAPPFREVQFEIMYGKGISKAGEILDLAIDHDIILKSGAWFSFGDERLGQGRENIKQKLEEEPELRERVEKEILARTISAGKPAAANEGDSLETGEIE